MTITTLTRQKQKRTLRSFFGHVARTSLSEEDEAALRQAIEHPEVKAGAEDHPELA